MRLFVGNQLAPAFVVLLLGCLSSPVSANGPNIGYDAGGIVPLTNDAIQLVKEFVTVPVEGGRVRCQYNLRNLTGSRQAVTIGFVTDAAWRSVGSAPTGDGGGERFRVQQRSGEIAVRREAAARERWAEFVQNPPDSLPVWDLSFEANEEIVLSISYNSIPTTGCDGSNCGLNAVYYAKTASLWAGTVEYASIRFEFGSLTSQLLACSGDAAQCLSVATEPNGAESIRGGFVWEYRDWEPDTDFSVRVDWKE